MRFNSPPGWPSPPAGWVPPTGWQPDPSWPLPPEGWQLWLSDENDSPDATPLSPPRVVSEIPPQSEGSSAGDQSSEPSEDRAELLARISALEALVSQGPSGGVSQDLALSDQQALQEVGIYRYHHPLENAEQFKVRLKEIESTVDGFIKAKSAILAADLFTFDGSLAKGRKMVGDLSKLMLRAYNAEADNCVRALRSGNIAAAKKRLEAAVSAIEKLGTIMEMRVNPDYHALRVQELELTADFQMKVQEEREKAREEREQLREQRRAEQELIAERERLDKERAHYVSALETLAANGDDAAVEELRTRLSEIESAIEQNDYRTANIRAGYVYVISNQGAFGPNIVKIGMTRRLEPRDRVNELGGASVPFPFDIHALYFSQDAISLEGELHRSFEDRRVNFVNMRREFFFAQPSQVRDLLAEKVGGLLEFVDVPEALEYQQSRSRWPEFGDN